MGLALHQISQNLRAFEDPELQVGFLRDRLARLSLREVVDLLALSLGARHLDPTGDHLLLLALYIVAGPDGSDPRRAAIAGEARRQGLMDVAFFVTPRPPQVPDVATRPMPYSGARALTLGERKSLARGTDPQLLARVIRDPHPDVIAVLMKNRRLTEADMVRLAARRPVDPEVLITVLSSLRWSLRYEVRKALAQNPFLPLGLAVPLVASMRSRDAREIASAADLREPIRDGAERVRARNGPHPFPA